MTAFLLVSAAAVSCEKGDPNAEKHDPMAGRGYIYPNDDVELFVHKILMLDDDNNIVGTQGGLQLDEGDPGKITIVAEDYPEAEKFFEDLFPGGAETFKNGDNYIWNLKDTLNVKLGQAVLKPVTGAEDGRIAEIEVPVCARPLSSVVFIPQSAIPLNDDYFDLSNCDALDYYYLGATVTVEKGKLPGGSAMTANAFQRGSGDFVVIRDFEPGKRKGFLLRLDPGECNYATESTSSTEKHRRRASYSWTLETVHKILEANPSIHSNFSSLGWPSWDHQFMCRKNNVDQNDYRYHLKNGGGLEKLSWYWNWYYYEAFVYFFTLAEGEDGNFSVDLEYE